MTSHPNRSKKTPKPGRNPTPEEVKQARKAAGLTQVQAAKLLYKTVLTWKNWEYGTWRMEPGLWELFLLKTDTQRHKKMMEQSDLSTPDAPANETGERGKGGG